LNRIILKTLLLGKKLCKNFGFGTSDFSRLFVFSGCSRGYAASDLIYLFHFEISVSQTEFDKSEIENSEAFNEVNPISEIKTNRLF